VKTIVIANNKGRVGKTTVASQLAFYLGRAGYAVMAVDLDGQRNLTSALRGTRVVGNALQMIESGNAPKGAINPGEIVLIKGDREVPVSSDDEVLQSTVQALDGLQGADFCIVDTPPTFSALVYGALLTADFMLSPIELKRFSLDGVEGVLKAFVQVQDINDGIQFLGLLPSRFDAVKQSERETLQAVAESYANLLVPHAIRNRVGYEAAEAEGIPVYEVPTSSGREAALEFGAFVDWFLETVGKEI